MRRTAPHPARVAAAALVAMLLVLVPTPADHPRPRGPGGSGAAGAHPGDGSRLHPDTAALTPPQRHPQPRQVDAPARAGEDHVHAGSPTGLVEDATTPARPGRRSNPTRAVGTRAPPA